MIKKKKSFFFCVANLPFRANAGIQTTNFPYRLNDPNPIPFSVTAWKINLKKKTGVKI
jgi:hypothetical protein